MGKSLFFFYLNVKHFSHTFIHGRLKRTNKLKYFFHFPDNISETYENKNCQRNCINGGSAFLWIALMRQVYTVWNENKRKYEKSEQDSQTEWFFSNRLGRGNTIKCHMLLSKLEDFHFYRSKFSIWTHKHPKFNCSLDKAMKYWLGWLFCCLMLHEVVLTSFSN